MPPGSDASRGAVSAVNRESVRLRTGVFTSEPDWLPRRRLVTTSIPEDALTWLFDPASLTRRVRAMCGECFRVRVLRQHYARPMFNERRVLAMADHERGMVRHVQLLCDGEPLVFARTVIPLSTLKGARRRLARLGDRPLGEMLFADKSLQRLEVQVARIGPAHDLFTDATASLRVKPAVIWGRRSVFRLKGKPLLVSEIFLPRILKRMNFTV